LGGFPKRAARRASLFAVLPCGSVALRSGERFFFAARRVERFAAEAAVGEKRELRSFLKLAPFIAAESGKRSIHCGSRLASGRQLSEAGSGKAEFPSALRHRQTGVRLYNATFFGKFDGIRAMAIAQQI